MDSYDTNIVFALAIGFLLGGIFITLFTGSNISPEEVGIRVCNSHDAEFLKVSGVAERILCIKDSKVIVLEDLDDRKRNKQ